MKKYLSDIIDENTLTELINSNRDLVIDTPTGSGKTTFVFNRLLPYAAERGMYVAYFCNRRVISKQVSEEAFALSDEAEAALKTVPQEYRNYLRIYTYQSFEAKHSFWKDDMFKPQTCFTNLENPNDLVPPFWELEKDNWVPTFYWLPDNAFVPAYYRSEDGVMMPYYYFVPNGQKAFVYGMQRDGTMIQLFREMKDGSKKPLEGKVPSLYSVRYTLKEPNIGYSDYDAKDCIGERIMFFVFDEAHYFISDARFNKKIDLWLKAFTGMPRDGRRIFFTATPDPLYCFLYAANESQLGYNLIEWIKNGRETIEAVKKVDELLPNDYLPYGADHAGLSYAMTKIAKYCGSAGYNLDDIPFDEDYYVKVYQRYKQVNPNLDPLFEVTGYLEAAVRYYKDRVVRFYADDLANEYDKMQVHYLYNYSGLIPLIKDSPPDEKWIIFIDVKRDGIMLSEELNAAGCSSTVLSKDSIKTERAGAEYQSIIARRKFNVKVLIATEVMDCGVSIHDADVKHIVISHPRKAVFLQMLGRVRLGEMDELNVYIKCQSAREIQNRIRGTVKSINGLADAELLNREKYVPKFADDKIEYTAKPYWDDRERDAVFEKLTSDGGVMSLVNVDNRPFLPENANKNHYPSFIGLNVSLLGMLSLIYDLSLYRAAIKQRDFEGDRAFYVKYQLGWLGKEYDVTRWVGYEKSADAVRAYCEAVGESGAPPEDVKRELIERFSLCSFMPESLYADAAKYKREGRMPGKKKLNDALCERGIGYVIKSKTKCIAGKRVTYWKFVPVVPRDPDDDRVL